MDNILLFILLNFLMFLVLSVVIVIIKLSSLGLKYFSLKIELEHHVDGNQEEEDDGFDGDDDEEDSEEDDGLIIIPMEMLSRRVSSRVAVGTALQDVAVINDGLPDGRKKEPNTCEFDVCGICLEAWASDGDHQIWMLDCFMQLAFASRVERYASDSVRERASHTRTPNPYSSAPINSTSSFALLVHLSLRSPQISRSHTQFRDGDLPIHIRVCQRGTP
ncbi:hypothetical protein L1987_04898 [Smallanthus sonchifolius]|uniref:Uncharacterized protein n=1 Tax=Smallanthus sonchifolius TaxID=185202 RepID=A0ACB9JTX7_9ASTR|nr:hypothetical protein L1987_04898 [Smallanthus sonchifolius]